jgi:hypothetical protein
MPTSSFWLNLVMANSNISLDNFPPLSSTFDEIIAYGTLCKCIEDLEDEAVSPEDKVWTLKDVLGHQGPLKKSHKEYKGFLYNFLLLWDNGSETYEPLDMVIKYDPVTLAAHAHKHGLLNEPGWKKLKTIARSLVHNSQGAYHLHYNVMANKQNKGPSLPIWHPSTSRYTRCIQVGQETRQH